MQIQIEKLATELLRRRWTMVTAESCTGGGLAWRLTAVPGSSAWLDGGFVTYSNAMKKQALGVSERLLAESGAVSQPCVEAMAIGALANSPAKLSVAISGIAGPDGGSLEKPVGTVWIAWDSEEGGAYSRQFAFKGDRYQVREQAIEQAILGLLKLMSR